MRPLSNSSVCVSFVFGIFRSEMGPFWALLDPGCFLPGVLCPLERLASREWDHILTLPFSVLVPFWYCVSLQHAPSGCHLVSSPFVKQRHYNQLSWSWFQTLLLTRVHQQPLLANPSPAVHNSTNVRFPSGPGNFCFGCSRHAFSRWCGTVTLLIICGIMLNQLQLTWMIGFLPYSIAN